MPELPPRLTLALHVICGAEPIAGELHAPGGQVWTFVGWLELSTALDAARSPGQPGSIATPLAKSD